MTVPHFLQWLAATDSDSKPASLYREYRRTHDGGTPSVPTPPPDDTAFEQLYKERFASLCDYANSFLRAPDEAHDVVQDVFESVWRHRAEVWAKGEPIPYMITAVRNRALNMLRGRSIRTQYAERAARDFALEPAEHPHENALLDRVYDAIDALPARAREVLLLRWRHGLSLDDIARVMGIGLPSVRVAHTRALSTLRKQLAIP